jgi:hypothetical protein
MSVGPPAAVVVGMAGEQFRLDSLHQQRSHAKRRISVSGSAKVPGWDSWKTLVSVKACRRTPRPKLLAYCPDSHFDLHTTDSVDSGCALPQSKNYAAPQSRVPAETTAANYWCGYDDRRHYYSRGDYNRPSIGQTFSSRPAVKAATASAAGTGGVDAEQREQNCGRRRGQHLRVHWLAFPVSMLTGANRSHQK